MLVYVQCRSWWIAENAAGDRVGRPVAYEACVARCARLARETGEPWWPVRV